MRVIAFAAAIVMVVALGQLAGWYWWPYIAWPATGLALVVALFAATPRGAGVSAAAAAFAIWSALVLVFIVSAYDSNRDGSLTISNPVEGAWLAARVIALVGVPLALGTGALAALGSMAGRRSTSVP